MEMKKEEKEEKRKEDKEDKECHAWDIASVHARNAVVVCVTTDRVARASPASLRRLREKSRGWRRPKRGSYWKEME